MSKIQYHAKEKLAIIEEIYCGELSFMAAETNLEMRANPARM
ncbi:hypothetical protein [Paenibacillus germinis]|nr:hypothetical protein [Paenibacillus germinis]